MMPKAVFQANTGEPLSRRFWRTLVRVIDDASLL
jgi:hypothetical protein